MQHVLFSMSLRHTGFESSVMYLLIQNTENTYLASQKRKKKGGAISVSEGPASNSTEFLKSDNSQLC